jgi:hypothetical protein
VFPQPEKARSRKSGNPNWSDIGRRRSKCPLKLGDCVLLLGGRHALAAARRKKLLPNPNLRGIVWLVGEERGVVKDVKCVGFDSFREEKFRTVSGASIIKCWFKPPGRFRCTRSRNWARPLMWNWPKWRGVKGEYSDRATGLHTGRGAPLVMDLLVPPRVDHVTIFDDPSVLPVVEHMISDLPVKGGHCTLDQIVSGDEDEAIGGRAVSIPNVP